MATVAETRSVPLLVTLGVTGLLLILGGIAMFLAMSMGILTQPPLLVVTPIIVGLVIAVYVCRRAAHDLDEMERGNITHAGRRTVRVAHRLGAIGSVIGMLIVAAILLATVVGGTLFSDAPH